jgi:hypothetical protein
VVRCSERSAGDRDETKIQTKSSGHERPPLKKVCGARAYYVFAFAAMIMAPRRASQSGLMAHCCRSPPLVFALVRAEA